MSRACESCDTDFEPWEETICDTCQETHSAETRDGFAKLQAENTRLRGALEKLSKDDGYMGKRYEDIYMDHKRIAKQALETGGDDAKS